MSNAIAAWQASLGGGGFGGMMGRLGGLIPTNGCGCACISNTTVYLTNMVAALTKWPGHDIHLHH